MTRASPARRRWEQIIRRQRDGGLSVAEFCRRENVPPSSLFAWRRRLAVQAAAPAPVFVEVTPAAVEQIQPDPPPLELCLGDRRVLVRRGLDAQALRELLGVLEALR